MAVWAVGDQIHTVQVVTLRQCLDFHQLATARARDVPYIPATTFCGCSFLSEGDDRILWLDILTDDECRICFVDILQAGVEIKQKVVFLNVSTWVSGFIFF